MESAPFEIETVVYLSGGWSADLWSTVVGPLVRRPERRESPDRGPEVRAPHTMIEALSAPALAAAQDDLVNLLRSCVHGGASLGFLAPLAESDAIDYWGAVAA